MVNSLFFLVFSGLKAILCTENCPLLPNVRRNTPAVRCCPSKPGQIIDGVEFAYGWFGSKFSHPRNYMKTLSFYEDIVGMQ